MKKALLLCYSCIFVQLACDNPPGHDPDNALHGNHVLEPIHTRLPWPFLHVGLFSYTHFVSILSHKFVLNIQAAKNSLPNMRINLHSVPTGFPGFGQTQLRHTRFFDVSSYPEIYDFLTPLAFLHPGFYLTYFLNSGIRDKFSLNLATEFTEKGL